MRLPWTWDDWEACTIHRDGTGLECQTEGSFYSIGGLAFSANSEQLLFTADESRNSESKRTLFTVTLSDQTIAVSAPQIDGEYYSWCSAPDMGAGDSMVFISDRNDAYHYDVYYANPNGEQTPLKVTTKSRYNQNPVWASEIRILYLAGTEYGSGNRPIFSLWSVNSDGTTLQQVADSDLFSYPLEWTKQTEAPANGKLLTPPSE